MIIHEYRLLIMNHVVRYKQPISIDGARSRGIICSLAENTVIKQIKSQ